MGSAVVKTCEVSVSPQTPVDTGTDEEKAQQLRAISDSYATTPYLE